MTTWITICDTCKRDDWEARGPERTDGERLAALVIGYEIAGRAAIALHATVTDYHTSGAWNGLGVAALAVLGVWAWTIYADSRDRAAQIAFADALEIYSARVDEPAAEGEEAPPPPPAGTDTALCCRG